MIISSSFCYLFFNWRCFKVSFFRQCSIVVLHCSIQRCFHRSGGVPLFRWCSVILALFRRSAGVPCSGVPLFRVPVLFRLSAGFRVPVFRWCSVVPSVFRVSSFRVPVFLVLQYAQNKELLQTAKDIGTPLLLAQFNKRQICFNIPKMGIILYFKEYQFI